MDKQIMEEIFTTLDALVGSLEVIRDRALPSLEARIKILEQKINDNTH